MKKAKRETTAVIDNKKLPIFGKPKNTDKKISSLHNSAKSSTKTERLGSLPFSQPQFSPDNHERAGEFIFTKKISSIKSKEDEKQVASNPEHNKVMEFSQLVEETNKMELIEKEGVELKNILGEQRESLLRFRQSLDLELGSNRKLEPQLSLDSATHKLVPIEKMNKLKTKIRDLQEENSSLQDLNLLLESNSAELKRSVNCLKEGWRRDRIAYQKNVKDIYNYVERELSQLSERINNAVDSVEKRLDKISNIANV